MKITKSKLKQIIKEELGNVLSEVNPAAQKMRDDIAAHQGVESTPARSGQEIADELGYGDKPDPKDIQILQAIKELLESSGRRVGTDGLARELQRLAEIVAKNPEFDTEEPETSDVEPLELPPVTGASHRRMRMLARQGKHGIE